MRPTGEIHQALLAAAEQGPGTMRDLARRAQVGFDAATHTVKYMARCGALKVVDATHVSYCNRLVNVYELVPDAPALPEQQPTPGWDDPVFYDLQNIWPARLG